jgi:hypothetical protein
MLSHDFGCVLAYEVRQLVAASLAYPSFLYISLLLLLLFNNSF